MMPRTVAEAVAKTMGGPSHAGRGRRLSPTEYTREYHPLLVNDPRQGLFAAVQITRYQNGPRAETSAELDSLFGGLAKILKVKKVPNVFRFPTGDVMDPVTPYYRMGLRRVYNGKGSPAEMADAIRLAMRCGRIGKGKAAATVADYATKFLGLDCNGLVGNYFGLSPALHISIWALGEPAGLLSWSEKQLVDAGWKEAELGTAPYVPLNPRHAVEEVCDGDVLITVIGGTDYSHIAMVDKVKVVGTDRVRWSVVEWGEAGGESKHIKAETEVTLVKGSKKKFGLGFAPKAGKFRYLFAAPDSPYHPATWGRCGRTDI
jgi:hypothetical protein